MPGAAWAHGSRAGHITVDHPYALPTAGASDGAVYFRTLINRGKEPDRLVAARTPVAAAVEIRGGAHQGLEVPGGAQLKVRHDGDVHLALVGLKAPLQDGQRFALWLRFEHAGEIDVTVWVLTPRRK